MNPPADPSRAPLDDPEIRAFPAALRELLAAELAAGNSIAEIGHGYPAAPVGAYVRLSRPVATHPRQSSDGIDFYDRNTSTFSGEFADPKRHFFVLEPPHPPEPEPDMDAIRAALQPKADLPRENPPADPTASGSRHRSRPGSRHPPVRHSEPPPSSLSRQASPASASGIVGRFEKSMVIDYEKWREGIGYDLDALRSATADERRRIERLLLDHGVRDWRDVEALAALDSPTARAALQAALDTSTPEIRLAVELYAPRLCPPEILAAVLVEALERAEPFAGLTQALDRAATFHPPEVIDVLFRAALHRRGEVAPSFAALLMHLHGRAPTRFDMAQRPFFLRFNTAERAEREAAFRELCAKIQVAPDRYLTPAP